MAERGAWDWREAEQPGSVTHQREGREEVTLESNQERKKTIEGRSVTRTSRSKRGKNLHRGVAHLGEKSQAFCPRKKTAL